MLTLSRLAALALLPAKTYNANLNGTGVDLQGYLNPGGRQLRCILDVGSQSGTTPTLDVHLEDSPDNVTYTDITGALFTQVGAALSHQEIQVKVTKRYLRAVVAVTGTTPIYGTCCLALVERTQA